jgi:MFS family permease
VFYGWVIVAISFVGQLVANGMTFYAFAMFYTSFESDLGAARAQLNLTLPLFMLAMAVAGPWVGRIVDRGRVRRVMMAGAILQAGAFLALSRVESVWQLWLVFAGPLAVGVALLGGVANAALISGWFVARRGLALAVSMMGIPLGGVMLGLFVPGLVEAIGWRTGVAWFCAAPLLVVLPLVFAFIRERPADLGLHPDGAQRPPAEIPLAGSSDWTLSGLIRTPSFWLAAAAMALVIGPNAAMVQTMQVHLVDEGLAESAAGRLYALMALMSLVGKPMYGWLGDRTGVRSALWIALGLHIVGLVLLLAAHDHGSLLLSCVVLGLGYAGLAPLQGLLMASVFGSHAMGRVLGLVQPIMLPLTLSMPPLMGRIFDVTGSFEPAYRLFIVLLCGSALLLGALRLRARKS